MKPEDIQKELDRIGEESRIRRGECGGVIPNRNEAVDLIKDLQSLLFPGYYKSRSVTQEGARPLLRRS